ncbi:MAG: (5-formylfuran-3-yl)methyl phosphate synthase [Burkholderiales bacterium]
MTQLLVSVKSLEEARLALGAGADILDLKDPAQGALGALPHVLVAEIVTWVNHRKPVSATLGDLPMDPELLTQAVRPMAATGVDYVKVGFFEACRDCATALGAMSGDARLVAVLFADREPDFDLLPVLARAGFAGVMLDTADKQGGGLRTRLGLAALHEFVTRARKLRLLTGLAGSLALEDISELLQLEPDYLGFRGAVCKKTGRNGDIDKIKLALVRRNIPDLPTASLFPALAVV